jgi:hypothetical protein
MMLAPSEPPTSRPFFAFLKRVGCARISRRSLLRGTGAGLALALLATLAGCGGNGFTGGGVPIGKSRLKGLVLSAESPRTPVPNALITVRARSGSNVFTIQRLTDTLGVFDIADIPTNEVTGEVEVSVTPENPALRSQQVAFLLSNGRTASLIVSLPRFSYDIAQEMTLRFSPPQATIQPGQSIRFDAQVRDRNGNELPLEPTLLFSDDFGTLNPDGTFRASSAGTGEVFAFWYNAQRAAASVIVNSPGGNPPPPPPQ